MHDKKTPYDQNYTLYASTSVKRKKKWARAFNWRLLLVVLLLMLTILLTWCTKRHKANNLNKTVIRTRRISLKTLKYKTQFSRFRCVSFIIFRFASFLSNSFRFFWSFYGLIMKSKSSGKELKRISKSKLAISKLIELISHIQLLSPMKNTFSECPEIQFQQWIFRIQFKQLIRNCPNLAFELWR